MHDAQKIRRWQTIPKAIPKSHKQNHGRLGWNLMKPEKVAQGSGDNH